MGFLSAQNAWILTRTFITLLIVIVAVSILGPMLASDNELLAKIITPALIILSISLLVMVNFEPMNQAVFGGEGVLSPQLGEKGLSQGGASSTMSIYILGAIMASLIFIAINVYKRREEEIEEVKEEDGGSKKEISSKIEKMVDRFDKREDMRFKIIKIYSLMSRLLEEKGVSEKDFLTPREFEERAEDRLGISKPTLSHLIDIFEEARYSSHRMDETSKDNAQLYLSKLKEELSK